MAPPLKNLRLSQHCWQFKPSGHSSCAYCDSPHLWLQSAKPTNNPSTRHILQIILTVTWHILQLHFNTFYFLLYGPMMANSIAETCSSWYSSQYTLRLRIIDWFYALFLEFLEDTGSESFRKFGNYVPINTASYRRRLECLSLPSSFKYPDWTKITNFSSYWNV